MSNCSAVQAVASTPVGHLTVFAAVANTLTSSALVKLRWTSLATRVAFVVCKVGMNVNRHTLDHLLRACYIVSVRIIGVSKAVLQRGYANRDLAFRNPKKPRQVLKRLLGPHNNVKAIREVLRRIRLHVDALSAMSFLCDPIKCQRLPR